MSSCYPRHPFQVCIAEAVVWCSCLGDPLLLPPFWYQTNQSIHQPLTKSAFALYASSPIWWHLPVESHPFQKWRLEACRRCFGTPRVLSLRAAICGSVTIPIRAWQSSPEAWDGVRAILFSWAFSLLLSSLSLSIMLLCFFASTLLCCFCFSTSLPFCFFALFCLLLCICALLFLCFYDFCLLLRLFASLFFCFYCLLCILFAFIAFCFSTCFLIVLLDCKCSYNHVKRTAPAAQTTRAVKAKGRTQMTKATKATRTTRTARETRTTRTAKEEHNRSCLCVPWGKALRPRSIPFQLFLFCCCMLSFLHFWVSLLWCKDIDSMQMSRLTS